MDALAVVARCHAETKKAVEELARMIAGRQPKRPGRYRYRSITRHAPGHVTADVVDTHTGAVRQFRFTKNGEGEITVEEL
jgi:hypothetical protein